MSLSERASRCVGAGFGVIGGIVCLLAVIATIDRAAAASVVRAGASAITCSSTGTSPCFDVTNTSSGVAVYGTSKNGTGLRGASTSNFGLKATSTSSDGVFGQSSSGAAGVAGTMKDGNGVYGYTTGTGGTGVLGESAGIGVYGYSSGGPGIFASSDSGIYALEAYGNSGTDGAYISSTHVGVVSNSTNGPSFYGRDSDGYGADIEGTYIGIVGRAPASGGYPLALTDEKSNVVFQVDGQGNVLYHGGLNSFARLHDGGSASTFGVATSAPTLEDTGTAQLAGGASSVRLDPTFAAALDTTTPYRVFITPHGDSRGLYVAGEMPAGFSVRESQGGRSSMTFDYRIVATPLGHARERMALVARNHADAEARASQPIVRTPPKRSAPIAHGP
ncbi:MAG: hypothetical protein IAI48_02855 [Candidatus Eremiobacteraeota bacterium]|nr:hypothetical protein [Candidatus Eremiobacteraeota bacterium]